MTDTGREQLGWQVKRDTWEEFTAAVREKWGAAKPYVNRELEDAVQEFLNEDGYAAIEARAQELADAVGESGLVDQRRELLSNPPDAGEDRTTVWASIHPTLKQDLATYAVDNGYPEWLVLTAAVEEYVSANRAERLQSVLSEGVVAAVKTATASPMSSQSGTQKSQSETASARRSVTDADPAPSSSLKQNQEREGQSEDVKPEDMAAQTARRGAEKKVAITENENVYGTPESARVKTVMELYHWDIKVDDELHETLSSAADAIVATLDNAPAEIRETVDSLCALHGIENKDDADEIVARQAVLNLFLKATLYEWYHYLGQVPTLDRDMRMGFRAAKEQTGNPAFAESELDVIVWCADESVLEPVIENRCRSFPIYSPAEELEKLVKKTIPREGREGLGQFWTPVEIAWIMRSWSTTSESNVLDPGMGAAALSSRTDPLLSGDHADHVDGVDVSPLAVVVGGTALALSQQPHTVRRADFLEMTPDDLDQDVDAIVCNPPFTRASDLDDEYKEKLNSQAQQATGMEISLKSPLYAYFYYHFRQFLDAGDRAAVLTPQRWLAAGYGDALKQYLLDEFNIQALMQLNPESGSVFADAEETCLVALLDARGDGDEVGSTQFIRVNEKSEMSAVRRVVEAGQTGEFNWGRVTAKPQADLDPETNWQRYFMESSEMIETAAEQLPALGSIAEVNRGIGTGYVNIFCLTQTEVENFDIPDHHLSKLIRKPRVLDGYDFEIEDWRQLRNAGEEVWLLDVNQNLVLSQS